MIHTSDSGLLHDADNDSILGYVGFEIKEVVPDAPRMYELLSIALIRYEMPPIIVPSDVNVNLAPCTQCLGVTPEI